MVPRISMVPPGQLCVSVYPGACCLSLPPVFVPLRPPVFSCFRLSRSLVFVPLFESSVFLSSSSFFSVCCFASSPLLFNIFRLLGSYFASLVFVVAG